MHPISLTSKWLAAARAIESCRVDRLFEDPYAGVLAGREGFEQLESFERIDPRQAEQATVLALRTRFFDQVLFSEAGLRKQVVIVASGMDARAYRSPWPAGTVVFEIDQSPVLDQKAEWFKHLGAKPRCDRRIVAVDLRQDWASPLIAAGFDLSIPTAWLMEGLLVYMPPQAAHRLLDTIAALSAANSWIGFDLPNLALLQAPSMVGPLAYLSKLGAPWLFASDKPDRQIVERHGWRGTVTDGAAFAVEMKRLLSPGPRALAGQMWLVSAHTKASHASSVSLPAIRPGGVPPTRK